MFPARCAARSRTIAWLPIVRWRIIAWSARLWPGRRAANGKLFVKLARVFAFAFATGGANMANSVVLQSIDRRGRINRDFSAPKVWCRLCAPVNAPRPDPSDL
jgi:hypothetical protein